MRIPVVADEIKLANSIRRALELQKYAVDAACKGNAGPDPAVWEQFEPAILDIYYCRSVIRIKE